MRSKKISKELAFKPELMFQLVSDVENYPKFVPACKSLKIISKDGSENITNLVALMEVGYGLLYEKFTSEITLNKKQLTIKVVNSDGPFERLNNYWKFSESNNGSSVEFEIEFEAKETISGSIINIMFDKVFAKYMNAFEKRADYLYS
ncbi:MAG: ubiquinone-binding protein [Rhodobiaceae bacterium]|nr:ubiquinone-binding protein [Rhodobiaceae bacterium]RPF95647.1 MAG: type II toxin-antitoxin system RatA family toxin [Rhizobiales bacterium TMED227]|tara:strand:- start:531 stop:974 length:444 start_codon:yes stop_codon:yes gene_type:complete